MPLHKYTQTSINDVHAEGRGVLSSLGGDAVCNPPPTMYDPLVFCDSPGKRESVYLMTAECALLLTAAPTQ